MVTPRNASEFCKLVENRLGWAPPANVRPYQRYMREANKVMTRVETNPALYTWENLALAVELLARERTARTPVGVFAHVERALEMRRDPEDDIETRIREVVAYETERGDPDGWVVRFARAEGPYRAEALDEWKQS